MTNINGAMAKELFMAKMALPNFVKENVTLRLMPSEKVEDRAVSFASQFKGVKEVLYIKLYDDDEQLASVQVTDNMITAFDLPKPCDLYDMALKNLEEEFCTVNLGEMLGFGSVHPLTIVSTKSKIHGAAAILCKDKVKEYCLSHGLGDKVYVLPSSVHEVLILPESEGDLNDLLDLVCDVNSTSVSADDFLANGVWLMDF